MAHNPQADRVYWQAHRGGGAYERPDNTMVANLYAWSLGGIPEADIRTTRDGVIVCLHDETPARTTTAPDEKKDLPISELDYSDTLAWDSGVKFDPRFAGERIPSLVEVFEQLRVDRERSVYLDLKQVDLDQLGALIDEYGVNGQVIFTHNQQANCKAMKRIANGVRSMLWIGGSADAIREKFLAAARTGFDGLDQVQLHLNSKSPTPDWMYDLDAAFLREALQAAADAGVDFEVLPFQFDDRSLRQLLDLGIRWYATDEPMRFSRIVQTWAEPSAV
ncbi:glycerophosphodiester phosphodiesterase [Paenibacillus sp. HJGM_3]|uniref:glycerophosphodiester phosphodiesterase n=1 Tax=Paenibacillus sp. HJGM_3 TaxID=3379816 RepID=UPI00385D5C83